MTNPKDYSTLHETEAGKIFLRFAYQEMKEFQLTEFIKTHPTLYDVIIKSIQEAYKQRLTQQL